MAQLQRDPAARGVYHHLDMGKTRYGDCILVVFGDTRILIDGAHPGDWQDDEVESIPNQLAALMGHDAPFDFDLLVVTHCHGDHIGCLPRLVEDGTITARHALVADERFGYGRLANGEFDALDARAPAIKGLVTALLEEDHSDLSDTDLAAFLDASATQEEKYIAMLATLEGQGTNVVRYGRAPDADVRAIEQAFAATGLTVLGPTADHLILCADQIRRETQDAVKAIDLARATDRAMSLPEIFRSIAQKGAFVDMLDMYGEGSAKNCQSIVLAFGPASHRVLLAGDMQFGEPQVDNLVPEMDALKVAIAAAGPYEVAKLTHHTSYNGFEREFLEAIGDPRILIHSGGWNDVKHPDRNSLRMLKRLHQDEGTTFARTDRNGLISVDRSRTGAAAIKIARGNLNDFTPNTESDITAAAAEAPAIGRVVEAMAQAVRPGGMIPAAATNDGTAVELLFVRIPYADGRVDLGGFPITITRPAAEARAGGPAAPAARGPAAFEAGGKAPGGARPQVNDARRLGGGRDLRNVLFVTNPDRLAQNIGQAEARAAIALIEQGADLLAVGDTDGIDRTRQRLQARDRTGVVLVGGYDVLPAQRVDVLDRQLRAAIPVDAISNEPDRFVVWSDDAYVDVGGEGSPDFPVSRIPDGKSPRVVMNALTATLAGRDGRFGVRNSARPFADGIFATLPGSETLFESGPSGRTEVAAGNRERPFLYFMLHGDHADGTRYWGEDGGLVEAVHVSDLPLQGVGIALAGCCWGALTVDQRASQATGYVSPKTAEQSIALSLLAAGAVAFVGCTGAHYSPDEGGGFFGGPMHRSFWTHIVNGAAPAQALFDAKVEYLAGMPHGLATPLEVGIERKIYKQFTCLGLGW